MYSHGSSSLEEPSSLFSLSTLSNLMSLLTKAKSLKVKFNKKTTYSKDEIELALAYAMGDIRLTQLGYAIGSKTSVTQYSFIAGALAQYVREQSKS